MKNIFFDSTESIIRTLIITVLSYVFLILILRLSGKRTLSKMNAFDFVVTIAFGSTLASVMLNKNIAFADGALALFLLVALQFVITFLSTRIKAISHLVKSTPALVVYKGKMIKKAMKSERIDEDEIYAIIRKKGLASLDKAEAVVLETDGSLSVIDEPIELSNKLLKNLNQYQN